ncbi:MAG: FadR/GntR family transcriptional regulator [Devosia sp.]
MANLDEPADGGHGAVATASSIVAEKLGRQILDGMQPGSSLPSEADLAAQFAVSRLTVREAMKLLEGRGLVDLGRGRRAVVREPTGLAFSDFLSTVIQNDPKGLFDLIELRMSLEVQSATLAAARANRASIAAIETALQGMRDAADAGHAADDDEALERRFHLCDVAFHEAIALSSGNRLISYLFEAMAAPLQRSFVLSRRGHNLRGHTVADTIAAHDRVLQAIREKNPKAAAAAMRAHLEDTERDIRAGLSSNQIQPIVWRAVAG